MLHERPIDAPDLADLRDKTLGLRDSVNSARAHLYNQRETLRGLCAELAALRRLAAAPIPAPVEKEAAPDSARAVATSLPTGAVRRQVSLAGLLPYAVLAAFAIASQLPARRPAIAAATEVLQAGPAPEPVADDDRGDEAVSLVRGWHVPGDDRPIIERVQHPSQPPGARPAWSVERTGNTTYRVSFRPMDTEPALEFEADLDARSVEPSPDTAELLAPRLSARG